MDGCRICSVSGADTTAGRKLDMTTAVELQTEFPSNCTESASVLKHAVSWSLQRVRSLTISKSAQLLLSEVQMEAVVFFEMSMYFYQTAR